MEKKCNHSVNRFYEFLEKRRNIRKQIIRCPTCNQQLSITRIDGTHIVKEIKEINITTAVSSEIAFIGIA